MPQSLSTKKSSKKCPKCGGTVARIFYGYPDFSSDELNKGLADKTITLGGCLVTEDNPHCECNECGHQF
jgi:hypothetical protein